MYFARMNFTRLILVVLCSGWYGAAANGSAAANGMEHADVGALAYQAEFHARFVPGEGIAKARIAIRQDAGQLVRLNLAAPPARYLGFAADGPLERVGDRVIWEVPTDGGVLNYDVVIDHHRDQHAQPADASPRMDARMTTHSALLRLGDLFPPARARSRVGATSKSTLRLSGPRSAEQSSGKKWSFESRYGAVRDSIPIDDSQRRFDRPTGWLVAGEIGVRREIIANRRIAIAGPAGKGIRRIDTLAFLRWTLPALIDVFPEFPPRLLIAVATGDMWRGGLSGPSSLYLHANRPLISENGTSTVLHELVHVATSAQLDETADWIVEGLAEYYALEILRRSDGLSERRFQQSIETLRSWAETQDGRLREPSRGADTARAVLVFYALATELNARATSLDAIVAGLLASPASQPLDLAQLRVTVAAELGTPSKVLAGVEEVQ
jgi:hypothetical protein